jgi:hypothetical protein
MFLDEPSGKAERNAPLGTCDAFLALRRCSGEQARSPKATGRLKECSMKKYHIYVIAAFFAVLITYFGVNFLLGGMHSYA